MKRTLACALTNYEHYYAVGTNNVTINGGRMTVSETQEPYAVGYYNRGSTNRYSAVMVTAPANEIKGDIVSITLRLTVTTNNNNAVYVGRVTDTSNLTNTGGMPWRTGSVVGWIETDITALGYAAGCSYSLIQDSNSTGSVDIIVTSAELVLEIEGGSSSVRKRKGNALVAGLVYSRQGNRLVPDTIYKRNNGALHPLN